MNTTMFPNTKKTPLETAWQNVLKRFFYQYPTIILRSALSCKLQASIHKIPVYVLQQ